MATSRTTIDVLQGRLTMTVLGETVEIDVFEKKKQKSKRMKLHNCYNIKTEDVPVDVKPAPYDELEDFLQVLDEESRLFEKENEGRKRIEEEVVGQENVDVENVNLKKEIDVLRREKEEAIRLGKELASLVESQEEVHKCTDQIPPNLTFARPRAKLKTKSKTN